MCIPRATVSAVFCLVVPAFICIDLLISRVLKINDDDDDDNVLFPWNCTDEMMFAAMMNIFPLKSQIGVINESKLTTYIPSFQTNYYVDPLCNFYGDLTDVERCFLWLCQLRHGGLDLTF